MRNGPYVQNILDAILLSAEILLKSLGSLSLTLEAKRNYLTDVSTKNDALMGSTDQTSVIVQKTLLPLVMT